MPSDLSSDIIAAKYCTHLEIWFLIGDAPWSLFPPILERQLVQACPKFLAQVTGRVYHGTWTTDTKMIRQDGHLLSMVLSIKSSTRLLQFSLFIGMP
jgi:hypothetical protein